jgi:hypothetical protein
MFNRRINTPDADRPMNHERIWQNRLLVDRLDAFEPPVERTLRPRLHDSVARYWAAIADGGGDRIEDRLQRHREYLSQLRDLPLVIDWQQPEPLFSSLPDYYGVKGGYARQSLFRHLHGEEYPIAVRDVDLIRFSSGPDPQERALAQRFMPADFERGALENMRSSAPS